MSAVFQEFHQWGSAPALKLMSDSRKWYARQSQMTVFGTVPSLQDVQQNFSDCLAMAVGIQPSTRNAGDNQQRNS